MHALPILHRCLTPLLSHIHARRLATLFEAVISSVCGPALSLTDVGRRFTGPAALRHKIKRADRLLGNRHLQQEAGSIYGALCRVLLARIAEPVILVDWSDLKADQSLHLLRAALPVGGRALTLYEEVHPQSKLNNQLIHIRFLRRLAASACRRVREPIIVADAGFKVPFYRAVERRGWRWVGRVRGRDFLRSKQHWVSCKTLFRRATATPTLLGSGQWVRSNPLPALLVLVKQSPQGRQSKTAAGKRSRSKKSTQAARSAREPWLLVASPRLAKLTARQVVRLYRQRMQIEEAFRDLKSQHYGEGLERSRSRSAGRFTVLVLIASLAAFLLWLLGHRRNAPGTGPAPATGLAQAQRLLSAVPSPLAADLGDLPRPHQGTGRCRRLSRPMGLQSPCGALPGAGLWGLIRGDTSGTDHGFQCLDSAGIPVLSMERGSQWFVRSWPPL